MNLLERISATGWAQGFRPVNCGSPSCSRWLTHRQLSVRSVGVTMAENWYCSYRCLRATAQRHMARLLAIEASPRQQLAHTPLGLALVRHGLLSDSQYITVSQKQRQSGEDVGDLIARLGLLTEKQITHARATQWNCPVFTGSASIERSAFRIPTLLMERYAMAPLHYSATGDKLFVGFVYEVEYEALYAVEQIMGCSTQPCFITPDEFKRIISKSTVSLWEERNDTISRDSSTMTDALCAYGASIDAEQIAFARCGSIVWSRLRAGTKAADLLFCGAGSIGRSSQVV